MMGLEDDPFPLGPGNFSGVNSLLNFGGVLVDSEGTMITLQKGPFWLEDRHSNVSFWGWLPTARCEVL